MVSSTKRHTKMSCPEQALQLSGGHTFAADKVMGSALIMCLVFMATMSAIAAAALEAAWSGQRMISAYISHQQAFLLLERKLLAGELDVRQQISSLGLEHFLSGSQAFESQLAGTEIEVYGDWISSAFLQQDQQQLAQEQCGALFEVAVFPVSATSGAGSQLQLAARWEVCCESVELCMASEFSRQRRLWLRTFSSAATAP